MAHETSSGAECGAKLVRRSMSEQIFLQLSMERFPRKRVFGAVGFDYLLPINTVKNVEWQSIS